jgi:pimeloyl-ACP methyl ester carboxylesterase
MLRRAVLLLITLGVLTAAAWTVARWSAALLVTVALASPSADTWHARWLGEATRTEIAISAGAETVLADLYRPPRAPAQPPGILLVHGLSAAGRRQRDLTRLAGLLARHGHLILVPHLEGLAGFRLTGRELDAVRAAIAELQRRSASVAVAGFSFGAGPALVAAADTPDLRWVGSFGGYADLERVITFLATGTHRFGAERYVARVEEYNRWKLAALLVPFVDGRADRERLGVIVREKLADPSRETSRLEAGLSAAGSQMLTLVRSRREEEARDGLARLPASAHAALAALSPLAAVPRIRAPLLIAHGVGDPSIPFTESLRLAEAAGGRARVVLLRAFHHTGPDDRSPGLWERLTDAWRLMRLVDVVLHG